MREWDEEKEDQCAPSPFWEQLWTQNLVVKGKRKLPVSPTYMLRKPLCFSGINSDLRTQE